MTTMRHTGKLVGFVCAGCIAAAPVLAGAQTARPTQPAPASESALRDSLRSALSFLASFDHGFHADYARGDPLMYSAPSFANLDLATPMSSSDVVIAKGMG